MNERGFVGPEPRAETEQKDPVRAVLIAAAALLLGVAGLLLAHLGPTQAPLATPPDVRPTPSYTITFPPTGSPTITPTRLSTPSPTRTVLGLAL